MIGFMIDFEFVWGFQSKVVGYSKSSPAFTYPPPTTFLGAVAEVLAKKHSLGEQEGRSVIKALSDKLLAIGVRPLNCIPLKFADINKVIAVRLTGGKQYPSPEDPYGSFDAPAHGRTFLSLVSENEEGPILRYFLTLDDDEIKVRGGGTIRLEEEDLWEIHRIGSKESLVAVTEVKSFTPKVKDGRVTTYYSFPLLEGGEVRLQNYEPKWILEKTINPFKLTNYDPLTSYVLGQNLIDIYYPVIESPQRPPRYIVEVGGSICFYEWKYEGVIGIRPNK